jgi:ubiquinol-cytochrome c reductase cytochrome c1 subunit
MFNIPRLIAGGAVAGTAGFVALNDKAREYVTAAAFSTPDHGLHAAHHPWDHRNLLKSYDHQALRRGYQVYKEVCSACHSMNYVAFRNLVGVTHTEEEAKTFAAEYEYVDGPNASGEMFTRPGKVCLLDLLVFLLFLSVFD